MKNRFYDLAERAFRQGIYTFTCFLGLSDQDLFWQEETGLRYAGYRLCGGYEGAERAVIRFGNPGELGYEMEFPIACIRIQPLARKFADALTHRDFLGALMNLGIERDTVGDIKIVDSEAYLFCLDSVAEFICGNLGQVRHTSVRCGRAEGTFSFPKEEPALVTLHVPSLRADAVLARVCDLSREQSLELFRAGKVYIDGRRCENNSRQLKCGETVNARGYGKFRLAGEPRETRKGRLSASAEVFR